METSTQLNNLLQRIAQQHTPDEINAVQTEIDQLWPALSEEQRGQIRKAVQANTDQALGQVREIIDDTRNYLVSQGKAFDLGEWITIASYERKYGVKKNTIMNWIERGIIPAECVIVIEELNNIKLIKNQPYRSSAEAGA
ncbi:hypothetical protein DYU11_22535 [Fibrisoma montanum]|uniref:Uncharacterized protein n=1 Tax=Fibrisoma montanum TaxID=2305895 RepID=A0A418M2C9_9BACT|nr:hypothetical protein [Fibrisoma montanum]RIV19709.1 hypothetical protein DYU11_22535 [Fibrisoma montanum]